MLKTTNSTQNPDYPENEEYGNYTESDEDDYDYDYVYESDISDSPPNVNCTCFRTDIAHELQHRNKEVLKQVTIGGVPCGNIKKNRRCKCFSYGMHLITHEAVYFK